MKTEADTEMQDTMELARLFVLQMDPMLTNAVQSSIQAAKSEINVDEAISVVKDRMVGEEVLKKAAQSIDKIFTHEEIKLLIGFYESEAVKKMYKDASETFALISMAMLEIINDVIPPFVLVDKVIPLSKLNYQKEVKEFVGSALLEGYSTFCGPCQVMAPIFSELSIELDDRVKFCKLDLSSEFQLAKELEILSVPTIKHAKNHYKDAADFGVQEAKVRLASLLFQEEQYLLGKLYLFKKIYNLACETFRSILQNFCWAFLQLKREDPLEIVGRTRLQLSVNGGLA